MKYLFAVFLPPVAVFGCGKMIPGILNSILMVISGSCLVTGLASSLAPLLEVTASLLLPTAVVFWVVSCTHAVTVVYRQSEAARLKEEQLQFKQQLKLMQLEGSKRGLLRQMEAPRSDLPSSQEN